jgi:hypothetical protein
MEVVRKVLELFAGWGGKKERLLTHVVECLEPHYFFQCVEQARTREALLLVPRGQLPVSSLLHASREVPVVMAENHRDVKMLLGILRPQLGAGFYEAKAYLIRIGRDQVKVQGELELAASSLAEEWPAVIAVYPSGWSKLSVAGVIEVRAEGVCGVLALRKVV